MAKIPSYHQPSLVMGQRLIDRLNGLTLTSEELVIRDKIKSLLMKHDQFMAVKQYESAVFLERQIRKLVRELDDRLMFTYGMRLQDTILASADTDSIEPSSILWEGPQNAEAASIEYLMKYAPEIEAKGADAPTFIEDVIDVTNPSEKNSTGRLYADYIRFVGHNPVMWAGTSRNVAVTDKVSVQVTKWHIKTDDEDYFARIITQVIKNGIVHDVKDAMPISNIDQLPYELILKDAIENYTNWLNNL